MKIIASLILLSTLSVLSVCGQVREFPCRVDALAGDLMKTDVWDFSQQWRSDDRNPTSVNIYGDSLLAETIEGRRFWYAIANDSIFFRGEEDRLTAVNPDTAVFVIKRPLSKGSSTQLTFTAAGTGGGKRFPIAESVTLDYSISAHPGRLILAPGDTIYNVLAVIDRRLISATFPSDSASVASQTMTETVKWYDIEGIVSLLPLAVQYSVYSPYTQSSEIPSFSAAYLPERGDYPSGRKNERQEGDVDYNVITQALTEAIISCDGRSVLVSYSLPQRGLTLCVDIVDAAGHGYIHQSAVSDGTENELSVDCSFLRNGEYIAVLSVENIPVQPKKELVIIR